MQICHECEIVYETLNPSHDGCPLCTSKQETIDEKENNKELKIEIREIKEKVEILEIKLENKELKLKLEKQ